MYSLMATKADTKRHEDRNQIPLQVIQTIPYILFQSGLKTYLASRFSKNEILHYRIHGKNIQMYHENVPS